MKPPGQFANLTKYVERLQYRAGIEVTGKLDDETKKLFIIPRCGVLEEEDEGQVYGNKRRKKRYYLQGTRWRNKVSDLYIQT